MERTIQVFNSRLHTLRPLSGDDSFTLREMWRVIWHRKWRILVVVSLAVLLAIVVVSFIKPVYRASATLLIDKKKTQAVSFEPARAEDRGNSQYQDTRLELLRSRSLAAQVVQSLDLVHHPEFAPAVPSSTPGIRGLLSALGLGKLVPSLTKAEMPLTEHKILDGVTERFLESISIEPQGKSSVVKVNVDMNDPATAAAAANALLDHYIDDQMKASTGSSRSARIWMTNRLARLDQQLKASEARLQAYREAENLLDVKGVGTISASELSVTSEHMIDARRFRAEAESQYHQVQGLGQGDWERLLSVSAVMADPLVQQFKASQAKARAKVDELSGRYGSKHPAMEAARTELNAATISLRGQVEQVVAGIERNYQLAAANEAALQASVNTNKSQIQDISRKEFKLQALQREVDGNRQLYDTFMTRLKETTATADLGATNSRIVDEAVLPAIPIRPKKMLIVALVATLALLLTCALALLQDSLRRTFKGSDDVENSLNIPVLGILPLLKARERKHVARLFSTTNHQPFSESIRTIRTGLMLNSSIDEQHQIIVVTSAVPGEGKTTVSINLARALSQMERVLLIDGDLRRSSFNKLFNFPSDTLGLSDLIEGRARARECIRHVDGIDVLCAGSQTSNPLELLSSARFAGALKLLRGKYQRIVIDSPPTQAVSDALILSRYADTMIYVVKSTTTIATAEKGVERLLQFNAPVQGVVINQVDIKQDAHLGYRFEGF